MDLPSESAANALLAGEQGGIVRAVFWTGARAGLIAVGLRAAGEREHLWKKAIYASLAIEAFVLWWQATHRD